MASDGCIECEGPVIKFDLPKNMLVVGSTQSGKTQFVKRLLLNHENAFVQKVGLIIYCYGAWQDSFEELESELGTLITFRNNIPTNEELITIRREGSVEDEIILVLDDKMSLLKDNAQGRAVVETVCVTSHHSRVSCIITLQNVFHNRIVREISLNCHFLCLFRNNRSAAQIRTLGSQILPGQLPYFMESYKKATDPQFGYLFIDLSPCSDKNFQLRTAIFKGDDMIIYSPRE
jgi:hypothetical protein